MRVSIVSLGILVAWLLVAACPVVANPDLWATSSAGLSTDPGYEGKWKYCYDVYWLALPHGVSHVDVLLTLIADCECVCEYGYFAFADTVGSGPGEPDECAVAYYGFFACDGDPSTGVDGPLVKFEPFEYECEPGTEGWVHVCFYSVAAPIDAPDGDCVMIKYGTEHATGHLDGVLPGCDTAFSGVEATSWGHVKALFN